MPVRMLRIDWGVSRRALGVRAPSGSESLITLRFEAQPDGPEQWSLIDPRSQARVTIDPPIDPKHTRTHIRVAGACVHVRGPSLYAFVSIEHPDRPDLLYARTDIFNRLGIAGGRYQPLGVRVLGPGA